MKLKSYFFGNTSAVLHDPETGSDIATVHPSGTYAITQDRASRLAACWNACHGLDLPPDIPAGAVAHLVAAARTLLEAYDLRGYGCGDEAQALEDAMNPFTP